MATSAMTRTGDDNMTKHVVEPRNVVAPKGTDLHPTTARTPIKLDKYLATTRGDVLAGLVTSEFAQWHYRTTIRRSGKVEA